jgi:hypothetical protein
MRRMRTMLAGGIVLGMLALSACAADPDVSGLEEELAQIDGVNGAVVWSTHPGAPWNTQVNVTLFLDEASSASVAAAMEGALPVLAADPQAGRHDVAVSFADADRADYTVDDVATAPQITVMPEVYEQLGLADTGRYLILLRAGELESLG